MHIFIYIFLYIYKKLLLKLDKFYLLSQFFNLFLYFYKYSNFSLKIIQLHHNWIIVFEFLLKLYVKHIYNFK